MLRTRERMQAALAAKQHAGFVIPTAGRRRLLQAPIWFAPRIAAKFASTSYAWRTTDGLNHGIYTTNVQPQRTIDGSEGAFNPGGLLTWMDLDLMMFLSAVFLSRKVDFIDTDQRSIFAAIGYAALDDPPYQELRSAIARLVGTQIWTIDEAVDGRIDGPVLLPRLLETNEELKAAWRQEGRRNKLVVAVGHGWLSEVASENQVVDLNSYLYLVRSIRSADAISRGRGDDADGDAVRPPDVARSILLFLDSMRQIDGQRHATTVKTGWLLERFGDRQKSIPAAYADVDLKRRADDIARSRAQAEIHQKTEAQRTFGEIPAPEFKYLDPMHPNSRIRRSLDAMVRLGILRPYSVDGDRLTVTWADPGQLPRLRVDVRNVGWSDLAPVAEEGEQRTLVQVDKLTGSLRVADQAPEGVAITARADVLPPAAAPGAGSDGDDPGTALRHAEVAFLLRLVPIHRSTLAAARARGWADTPHLRHLLIITLWKKAVGQVRDAAAFAAKQLAELEPAAYERPALVSGGLAMDEIVAWWGGPASPKRIYADRWERLQSSRPRRAVAPPPPAEAPPPAAAVAPAGDRADEDEDEITQIAIELRQHQDVARSLGYRVATAPQRVRSAERIAADEKLYRQWRLAIAPA